MKPERSQGIAKTTVSDPWMVKPPYISQDFELRSFLHATKFAEFVHVAAAGWAVEVELTIEGEILTAEISPATGETLTKTTFDFVRGINQAYQIFHSGPTPES